MGTNSSSIGSVHSESSVSSLSMVTMDIARIHEKFTQKYAIPIDVQVAHYTPSIFPLVPQINNRINTLCLDSWKHICDQSETIESGIVLNGITLFYNDFYYRLHLVDGKKKIESILSSHANSLNKIAEKGEIIIRIVNYALSIKQNDEPTQYSLYCLGKAHRYRAIRPYMYSIFVQTLLYTISSRLENRATREVMEAWVNVFAFIMKSMLPQAICGNTVDTEIYINTQTEFSSDHIKSQVQQMKSERIKSTSYMRSQRSNKSNNTVNNIIRQYSERIYLPKLLPVTTNDESESNYSEDHYSEYIGQGASVP